MVSESQPCRLCGHEAKFRFHQTIMRRRRTAYFECTECGSMQTESPDWLAEAYAASDNVLDVGRAQRNLMTAMFCAYILEQVNLRRDSLCLDWGGAEGLFCRLMRDRGFNFFLYDRYSKPVYAIPFSVPDPGTLQPSVVTVFEVFEHLPDPYRDLASIFMLKPRFLIFSTELYCGQGTDWQYFSLYGGKHVFFYSRRAIEWIANHFGYRYHAIQFLHVFVSNDSTPEKEHSIVEKMAADPGLFLDQAGNSLLHHLSHDAWKNIQEDYLILRRERLGK